MNTKMIAFSFFTPEGQPQTATLQVVSTWAGVEHDSGLEAALLGALVQWEAASGVEVVGVARQEFAGVECDVEAARQRVAAVETC